jgi:hypothetical protein
MMSTFRTVRLLPALPVALVALVLCGCGGGESGDYFTYGSATDTVLVAYQPGPPARVFDSSLVVLALKPRGELTTDSLALELMPARGGWCVPVDSFLVRDSAGWYRARVWMRPTAPGNFVLRWQTNPFSGFTFYLVARYDSLGQLATFGDQLDSTLVDPPLLLRDTMELVFTYWPHVWYRRVHFIRRADTPRTYYVITQSLQREAGVSGRALRPTANLRLDPRFPLRTRRWDQAGWVVDTLSVWVRDTLVASIDWSYNEWVNNWEKNYTLFRDWTHEHHPDLYFQIDTAGHLAAMWTHRPAGRYIAAKLNTLTSEPDFESVKKDFIRGDPPPSANGP